MTTHKISEYIRMKDLRLNTSMLRKEGKNWYWINGRWATEKEYNRVRPMPEFKRFNDKGATIGHLVD